MPTDFDRAYRLALRRYEAWLLAQGRTLEEAFSGLQPLSPLEGLAIRVLAGEVRLAGFCPVCRKSGPMDLAAQPAGLFAVCLNCDSLLPF